MQSSCQLLSSSFCSSNSLPLDTRGQWALSHLRTFTHVVAFSWNNFPPIHQETNSRFRRRMHLFLKKMFYPFFRESVCACEWGRGREKRGQRRIRSALWVGSRETYRGLEPKNHQIMTWAEVRHSTDWATQVPQLRMHHKNNFLWGVIPILR